MWMKAGTYLGGIRDLATLMDRCYVDRETQCWHWRQALDEGVPKVHFVAPDTKKDCHMRGRRAAIYLRDGQPPKHGHVVWAASCCKSEDCVNPSHAVSGDRHQHGAFIRATGMAKTPAKQRSAAEMARKHRAKLNEAIAAEIRNSDMTIEALAKKYGVSSFCIWSIKAGKTWKPKGVSVFSWRAAA